MSSQSDAIIKELVYGLRDLVLDGNKWIDMYGEDADIISTFRDMETFIDQLVDRIALLDASQAAQSEVMLIANGITINADTLTRHILYACDENKRVSIKYDAGVVMTHLEALENIGWIVDSAEAVSGWALTTLGAKAVTQLRERPR